MMLTPPDGWTLDVHWGRADTAERWVWRSDGIVATLVVRGGAVQALRLRRDDNEHPHASLLGPAMAAVGEMLRVVGEAEAATAPERERESGR